MYKDNNSYKVEITSIKGTFYDNQYAFDVDSYINKIALSIKIGDKSAYYIDNILDKNMLSGSFTCNDLTYSKITDSIFFNFESKDNIDVSKLDISFFCYRKSDYKYTFEENFNAVICNQAPKIEVLTANFPNVSFKVSDDKKVSKVDVFVNDSIYKTISSDLDKEIKLTFNLKDFNVGENKIILKVVDNEGAYTNKTIKVVKEKIPIPKKDIQVVKNNKIYKVVNAEEIPNSEELILTLDKSLEEVSTLKEPIEILNDYATVKINDKLMNHVSSKALSNGLIEDKFELDINTRKVITRVDLFRESLKSNIYIKEIQEAFKYYKD